MTTIVFDLPNAEVYTSNAQRTHWRIKGPIIKALRARGRAAGEGIDPMPRAHATATLTFGTAQRRDPMNWWPTLKALGDGLVEAGVLPDDDAKHLTGPDMRISPKKGPKGRVLISLLLDPDCACTACIGEP